MKDAFENVGEKVQNKVDDVKDLEMEDVKDKIQDTADTVKDKSKEAFRKMSNKVHEVKE